MAAVAAASAPPRAAIALLALPAAAASRAALHGHAPLAAAALLSHTLPPRRQPLVFLEAGAALPSDPIADELWPAGDYYLLPHCVARNGGGDDGDDGGGGAGQLLLCGVQVEVTVHGGGGGGGSNGGGRPSLQAVPLAPESGAALPLDLEEAEGGGAVGGGGAGGGARLQQRLWEEAAAWFKPEGEEGVAQIAQAAAAPQMSKAASVIAAHVKGGAQRREMGEMQREMQRRLAVEMEELQQLQQSASIWAAAAMTEEKAACTMQAGYRGLVARREVEEERAAQQLAWMQAYRQGRITKLQSLFRGRCARRAAARRAGGGDGGGCGVAVAVAVPSPEAAQIDWELESPPGPSEAREPTLAASRGGSLRWELEAEVAGDAAHPAHQHAHESADQTVLRKKAAAAAAAAVAAGVATVATVGAGNAAWMPTRLDARLARLEETLRQVVAQQQQQHGHSATTAAAVAAAIAPASGGGSGGELTPRRGRREAEAALEQVRQELTAEREAARAREREEEARARAAARTPAQVAEEERAALRLQAGARGQAARRGVRELRRALDAPLHGAAAGVRVRDYELEHGTMAAHEAGHFEDVDFEEGHVEVAAACGWAGGWAGGVGHHHPALSDVTNAALGLGGWAALEAGATAAAAGECTASRFTEVDGGDQGAPLQSYVPRRHLRATVTTHGAPPPEHGTGASSSSSAALLPRLPEGTELPPLGYRSRVLALQQQQRSLLASLALPQPHAAARLLVQKDFALQALAEQRAEAAVMAASSNPDP